jgi:hypothetical protein
VRNRGEDKRDFYSKTNYEFQRRDCRIREICAQNQKINKSVMGRGAAILER